MNIRKKAIFSLVALMLASCSTVPITGRKQILLVSDQDVLSSSLTQYNSYLKTATKSSNRNDTETVRRVGKRIANATEIYLRQNGLQSEIKNFKWEFNLIKENQINAFCMPGGKIVVYEGLMNIVDSEDELAVVIGHEVAHAVAKHSNERMSQQMMAQCGAQVLSLALSEKSTAIQAIAGSVYGIGAQYGVMLPFSRKHESEADYMGLILMTIAGYNPNTAVGFWGKMAKASKKSVPEFLSTHPSDSKRIEDLRKATPEIIKKYGSF